MRNIASGIREVVKKRRGEGPSGSPEEGEGDIDCGQARRIGEDAINGWLGLYD